MILVKSPQFVLEQTEAVKSAVRHIITNYYFNKDILDYWTRMGLLFHEKIGETALFFKKDGDFFHLFYMSPSYEDLGGGLAALSSRPEILVPDVVTKIGDDSAVLNVFRDHGFHPYSALARMCMSRKAGSPEAGISDEIRFASTRDSDRIHVILNTHFDRYAEQIPSTDEIATDAGHNKIILIEKSGVIAGLIHYDLLGLTSHLRRWFVDPQYRDQHIGSKLLRSYFALSHRATRFILWVLHSNKNAIERYRHYGYREDNLMDSIFINKERMNYGK